MGAVVAIVYTVLNAGHPVGVGLKLAASSALTYCVQQVCARVGEKQPLFGEQLQLQSLEKTGGRLGRPSAAL